MKQIYFLIRYGSKKNDIDFLVVLNSNTVPLEYRPGTPVDIFPISLKDFYKLAYLFDPLVTEPILTGELLLGNEEELENLKKELFEISPSQEIIDHLKRQSRLWYTYCTCFLKDYKNTSPVCDSNLLLYSLINLTFAISYDYFAQYYSKIQKKGPITLRKLKNKYPSSSLSTTLSYLKEIKNKRRVLNDWRVEELIKNW